MFLLDNKTLPLDVPFKHNGIQYPANWLRLTTLAEKQAIGITEVQDTTVQYDDRFYWGVDNPKHLDDKEDEDKDGNPLYAKVYDPITKTMVDSSERSVTKGIRSNWTTTVKQTANSLLSQTDWMVIRKAERDVAIPEATVTYRAAVLAECTRLVTAITGAVDVPALVTVVTAQNWPTE
jgi:hypothetical protein